MAVAAMTVFASVSQLAPQEIWEGVLGRAIHGERATLSVVELDRNVLIPEHHHGNEQVGMVVSGSVTFRVGDESRDLEQGGTWCIPPNEPHEVRAGDEGAVVVEVFAPTRDDWKTLQQQALRPPRWPTA